ncbi:hypothetical protein, partial [Faecalibaculum rodentium]|uniref:hypothetical protein n=1 Tax=Faecalibaculum rodentium TaxID=1702221 RepID=UPI00258357D3
LIWAINVAYGISRISGGKSVWNVFIAAYVSAKEKTDAQTCDICSETSLYLLTVSLRIRPFTDGAPSATVRPAKCL